MTIATAGHLRQNKEIEKVFTKEKHKSGKDLRKNYLEDYVEILKEFSTLF